MWKKVNLIKGKKTFSPLIKTLKWNGAAVTQPEVISNLLAEHFANTSSTSNYTAEFQQYKQQMEELNPILADETPNTETYDVNFTMQEFEFALNSCKSKFAGNDEISYPMIKNAPIESFS